MYRGSSAEQATRPRPAFSGGRTPRPAISRERSAPSGTSDTNSPLQSRTALAPRLATGARLIIDPLPGYPYLNDSTIFETALAAFLTLSGHVFHFTC